MKRYQECNWFIKLLRRRHYLVIPFQMLWYTYIKPFKVECDEIIDGELVHTDNYEVISGKNLLRLLKGIAQGKMNWYWTHEEVINKLKNKIK